MQLIGPLVNGFADAPSGSAAIYKRGTTVAATVYSDFQGKVPVTAHVLDSRGRVVRYCNEMVDVVVYDSTGAVVAGPFTVAQQFSDTEIIHAHWTGTDYDTGQSALNKPLAGNTLLDKLYASFAADDGKVLVGGSQRYLKDVLLTGILDVRGPTYGAKGDGVTDDTTIIQAALNAAAAAGGGIVFFPPGTYVVSSLTISANIALLGAGSGRSVITTSNAAEVLLVCSSTFQSTGLKFSTTGKGLLRLTADPDATLVFTACAFSCTSAATVNAIDLTGFSPSSANGGAFYGCDFVQTGAGWTHALIAYGANIFGGSIRFASGNAFLSQWIHVTGTVILATASASLGSWDTLTGCTVGSTAGTLTINHTAGATNEYGTAEVIGTVVRTGAPKFRDTRATAVALSSGSATSYAPDVSFTSSFLVTSSGASFQWGTPTGVGSNGNQIRLWYKNTNASPITPTFSAAYKATAVSVASGSACGWLMEWHNGLSAWVQIGSPVAYAS